MGVSIQPITDALYGADHPSKRRASTPKRPAAGHYSLVQDLVDTDTLHKLQGLAGRLKAQEARRRAARGRARAKASS